MRGFDLHKHLKSVTNMSYTLYMG